MSVEDIIAQIRQLRPSERRRVRQALDELPNEAPSDALARQRLEEALRLLDEGWCEAHGRPLSEGIDEALYGGER